MSSLLDKFAYRKKENLSLNVSNEGGEHRTGGQGCTPNKAHLSAVVRILETPESLLPSPTSGSEERLSKEGERLHQRRRRRARIVSSSEDETVEPALSAPLTPVKTTGTLFSKLPHLKRRKCTEETQELEVTVPQSSRTLTLDPPNNHPRRLFETSNGTHHGLEAWGHCSGDSVKQGCVSLPAVGRRKSRKVIIVSSDSEEEEATGGKGSNRAKPRAATSQQGQWLTKRGGQPSLEQFAFKKAKRRRPVVVAPLSPSPSSSSLSSFSSPSSQTYSQETSTCLSSSQELSQDYEDYTTSTTSPDTQDRWCSEDGDSSCTIIDSQSPGVVKPTDTSPDTRSRLRGGPQATSRPRPADAKPASADAGLSSADTGPGVSGTRPNPDDKGLTLADTRPETSPADAKPRPAADTRVDGGSHDLAPISVPMGNGGSRPVEVSKNSTQDISAGRFYGTRAVLRKSTRGGEALPVFEKLGEERLSSDDEDVSEEELYSLTQRTSVLEFLNGRGQEELCDIPGVTMTKAEFLIQLRPFKDWEALVDVLASTKTLSDKIIDGCLCVLEERRVMVGLLSKCQDISASLQGHFSKLTNSSEGACADIQCPTQPAILSKSLQLKPYQLIGLNWMALLHSHNLNGILADEMGLGKTIQAIGFMAHLYEKGFHGPFLIIVPTSTLDTWARELEKWWPSLRVQKYFGDERKRFTLRSGILCSAGNYDVILSAYHTCIGTKEDRHFLRKITFRYLILDEAHMVKNMSTQRYSFLCRIKADHRLLLTGTPVQNNLLELVSLLSFVMPQVFNNFSAQLKKTFSRKIDESSSYYKEQVKQAKQIMQPFILRRLKSQMLQDLPGKSEETVMCQLTALQRSLYVASVKEAKDRSHSSRGQNMSLIMELRKIALHPHLVRHRYHDDTLKRMAHDILKDPQHMDSDPSLVYEDMAVMTDSELHNLCRSNKFLAEYALPGHLLEEDSAKFKYLKVKLQELKYQGSRVLLFSQFTVLLDIMEPFLRSCGHTYLRLDGRTPAAQRQSLIDQYNSCDEFFIFLLSTRAGGLGINLTAANVVILYDIDFNPYNDRQAQDRCHRLGQTREVTVLRLICEGTVEEGILKCAEAKLQLEQDLNQINAEGPSSADVAMLLESALAVKTS